MTFVSIPVVDELRRAAQQREQLAEAYARKAEALRTEARGFAREARRVTRITSVAKDTKHER